MFIPAYVQTVIDRLEKNGYEAYLVGGCVRDALSGRTPGDYDMAVSSRPEETKACFSDMRTIDTGIKHGTVTVVSEHHNLELTSFRYDGEYHDNRRPTSVHFTRDIHADVSRRDLTVNAMAFSPVHGLIDDYGGREDLNNKILRCVGDPYRRFEEDALRIMRTLRFAAVLGFDIEENTAKAAAEKRELLNNISAERIFTELKKTLSGVYHKKILKDYRDIIFVVLPVLRSLTQVEYEKAVDMISLCTSPEMRFAALISGLDETKADEICKSLKADNRFRKTVCYYIANKDRDFSSAGEVKRFAGETGKEKLPGLITFRKAAGRENEEYLIKAAQYLCAENVCLTVHDLKINGRDIQKIGFSGKNIGGCLDFLLKEVTEDRIKNDREELLRKAEEYLTL